MRGRSVLPASRMTLGLGLRLAVSGGRSGWWRLATMGLGVGLGVALLLGAGGVPGALQHRQDVTAARGLVPPEPGAAADTGNGIASTTSETLWRGQTVTVLRFRVVGTPHTPPPLGLDAVPPPGTTAVSPALAHALAGPHGDELTTRVPGRVTAQLGRAGLVGPDELYAVAATDVPVHGDETLATGFSRSVPTVPRQAGDPDVAARVGAVCLLVPLLVLIGVSVRLSGAAREQRNAAIRLVGATRRQMLGLAAAESAVVGAVGSVFGVLLFGLLRPVAAWLAPVPDGLWARDLTPSLGWSVLVLVGVPVLAALLGVAAQRRVVASPLGVTRQARAAAAGWWRFTPLVVGLVLLVVGYLTRRSLTANSGLFSLVLLAGTALVLLGLALAGATLARGIGSVLARFSPGPATQLAGRRLMMDPGSAGRAIAGTTLVVAVAGFILAFLPVLQQARTGYLDSDAELLRPGTLQIARSVDFPDDQAAGGLSDAQLGVLSQIAGVRAVVAVREAQVIGPQADPARLQNGQPREQDFATTVAAVSCEQLKAVLQASLTGCVSDQAQSLAPVDASLTGPLRVLSATTGEPVLGATVPAPSPGAELSINGNAVTVLQAAVRVPVDTALPADAVTGPVWIATDGRTATKEAVRARLATMNDRAGDAYTALTVSEQTTLARADADAYRRATLLGLAVVVVVGGLVLAVSMADGLRERVPAHAAMMAAGVPARVLRRSVLLQVGAPLLVCVGLATGVAALCGAMYQNLYDEAVPGGLPWTGYGIVALVAVVASLLAGASVLPLVRAARRPSALRVG